MTWEAQCSTICTKMLPLLPLCKGFIFLERLNQGSQFFSIGKTSQRNLRLSVKRWRRKNPTAYGSLKALIQGSFVDELPCWAKLMIFVVHWDEFQWISMNKDKFDWLNHWSDELKKSYRGIPQLPLLPLLPLDRLFICCTEPDLPRQRERPGVGWRDFGNFRCRARQESWDYGVFPMMVVRCFSLPVWSFSFPGSFREDVIWLFSLLWGSRIWIFVWTTVSLSSWDRDTPSAHRYSTPGK